MKFSWNWMVGLLLLLVAAGVLAAAQSSLWFLVFGRFPAPMLWIIVIVHISVAHPLTESTLISYLLALVNAAYTALPFEALLIMSLALMLILVAIRERAYWGGPTYFMLMVGAACILAPILLWIVSRWFDKNPIFIPEVFDWLISALLTTLFSLPLYPILQRLNRFAMAEPGMNESRIGPL